MQILPLIYVTKCPALPLLIILSGFSNFRTVASVRHSSTDNISRVKFTFVTCEHFILFYFILYFLLEILDASVQKDCFY
jgi:hypothetical protein